MVLTQKQRPESGNVELNITLVDVVQFIRRHYRAVLTLGAVGLVCGVAVTLILSNYTATVSLQNLSSVDLPGFRYL